MSRTRVIRTTAEKVKIGDFLMEAVVNGQAIGQRFVVDKIDRAGPVLNLHGKDDSMSLAGHEAVYVERTYQDRPAR